MKVFKVEYLRRNFSFYTDKPEEITELLGSLHIGGKISIEAIDMTEEEFNALPDFKEEG